MWKSCCKDEVDLNDLVHYNCSMSSKHELIVFCFRFFYVLISLRVDVLIVVLHYRVASQLRSGCIAVGLNRFALVIKIGLQ